MIMPVLGHGADYNPDQWLDRPDILEQDIELMKKARVNIVSLGIFAWAALEPEEGRFNFDWMAEIIDRLYAAGVSVNLATPTAARPAWMAKKYPEVRRVNAQRQRELYGDRHNHCYTSPVYREKTRIINQELARRFGRHPAVVLWHINNEYGGECHCELCQQAFRDWPEELYNKDLHDPDNHGGVVTHLEPDILECEVKWALGSVTTSKASGGDEIPAELFQILKDDAVKVLHSDYQQIWKTQQWPQDWKRSVFIPIPKKGNDKERSNYHTKTFYMLARLCSKPFKLDFSSI